MNRAMTYFSAVMLAGVLAGPIQAESRKYNIQDLEALAKTQAWEELLVHLMDVSPALRTPAWNRVVESACTRPGQMAAYASEYCFEPLKSVLLNEPDNHAFAWKAGKWARLNLASWSALTFFSKAGLHPEDARCKDPDISIATVSGLGQTHDETIKLAQTMAFQTCWPATKAAVLKDLKEGGYYAQNACGGLKKKGALTGANAKACTAP